MRGAPGPAFIDLFGAPGGMSCGFEMAGMKPLAALDAYGPGVATYRRNFRVGEDMVLHADASSDGIVERFGRETGLEPGSVDVVIGGPPCQGFSSVGRIKIASLVRSGRRSGRSRNPRFIDDSRNHLYKAFVKFVRFYEPKAVVMENVPGMVSYKNGRIVEQIKADLGRSGYKSVEARVINSADYGVPQNRRRIFFVATMSRSGSKPPKKTHFADDELVEQGRKQVTVMDAIDDLPPVHPPRKGVQIEDRPIAYGRSPSCEYQRQMRFRSNKVCNHITRWHRDKDGDVFSRMEPGQRWDQLSNDDRELIGYSDDSFGDKWKRLPKDKPSWTVVSHIHKDGYMYIHPTENRTISVREAARLQSFPDRFVFEGSRTAQFRQVGNAVPPLMARAVAKSLLRAARGR